LLARQGWLSIGSPLAETFGRDLPRIAARSEVDAAQYDEPGGTEQVAKNTITQITDDIDGSAEAETVSFGFQGASYSIDLAPKNLDKLTRALAPFIEHATKNRGTASVSRTTPRKPGRTYDLVQLREWARKNKIAVPSRGRIPGAVVDQYLAAGGR
jgi:hypothetical protein